MPDLRTIPILNLKPDPELSADQIVLVTTGKLNVLTDDGEKRYPSPTVNSGNGLLRLRGSCVWRRYVTGE